MNMFVMGIIIVVVILGLFIVYAIESEHGYDQGYNAAVEDYRQQMQNAMWQQYLNQMQGGNDDEEEENEDDE